MLLSCSCLQSTPRQAVSQVESRLLNLAVSLMSFSELAGDRLTTNNSPLSELARYPGRFLLFAKWIRQACETTNNSACPFQVIGRLQFSGNKKACPLWTRLLAVLRLPVTQNETGKRFSLPCVWNQYPCVWFL